MNEYGLDVNYFKEKLSLILRDIGYYKPEEMHRELLRLASVVEPSQAQQPNYKLNELAQMIMSDCGISTINNDALFNRILDRLINASDLQIRPDVLCGGCKGIRSSDCPDCNGSGKMTDPRAQAQQPSKVLTYICNGCGGVRGQNIKSPPAPEGDKP